MYFTFIATRSIAPGYSAGELVNVIIKAHTVDREINPIKKTHTAIGGRRFHRVSRVEESYTVKTGPIVGTEKKAIARMLFDSIADGSSFSINISGSDASPLTSMQLETPAKEQRLSNSISAYTFQAIAIL